MQAVLASRNQHKIAELSRVLAELVPGVVLHGDDGPEPVESGVTFAENALIKARAAAERTGQPALADDSGIAVQVMHGAPGIFSARWSGPARSDSDNVDLLLWQMHDVPDAHRQAAFLCASAAVLPDGNGGFLEAVVVAEWPGKLLRERRGENGFGYDPIFQPEGYDISAAELDPAEKDAISHRRRAFTLLAPKFKELLQRVA